MTNRSNHSLKREIIISPVTLLNCLTLSVSDDLAADKVLDGDVSCNP